jgi:hypothetical protein
MGPRAGINIVVERIIPGPNRHQALVTHPTSTHVTDEYIPAHPRNRDKDIINMYNRI